MQRLMLCQLVVGALLLMPLSELHADSLYSDWKYEGLVSDPRADRVGQALTILVYEQATAATSADRETDESVGVSRGYDEVTGRDGQRNTDAFGEWGLDARTRTEGRGSISRSGRLVASVSVTVVRVEPTGQLRVAGEQMIEFNEETQFITIEGLVRPEDISADNTVISTRLADAQISYVGHGLLGRQQKPGLITRFLGWLF
jgi:flagellar L-ring protein precursor FlgH